jgi:hypothetical protein
LHVIDLAFDPRQLQPPFACSLGLFESSLLSLEVIDAELGILNVVLALPESVDLPNECPIVFLQNGLLESGIRNSRP